MRKVKEQIKLQLATFEKDHLEAKGLYGRSHQQHKSISAFLSHFYDIWSKTKTQQGQRQTDLQESIDKLQEDQQLQAASIADARSQTDELLAKINERLANLEQSAGSGGSSDLLS